MSNSFLPLSGMQAKLCVLSLCIFFCVVISIPQSNAKNYSPGALPTYSAFGCSIALLQASDGSLFYIVGDKYHRFDDGGIENDGIVYVFNTLDGSFEILEDADIPQFGATLRVIPDTDGDGEPDLLVGGFDTKGGGVGGVVLFSGKKNGKFAFLGRFVYNETTGNQCHFGSGLGYTENPLSIVVGNPHCMGGRGRISFFDPLDMSAVLQNKNAPVKESNAHYGGAQIATIPTDDTTMGLAVPASNGLEGKGQVFFTDNHGDGLPDGVGGFQYLTAPYFEESADFGGGGCDFAVATSPTTTNMFVVGAYGGGITQNRMDYWMANYPEVKIGPWGESLESYNFTPYQGSGLAYAYQMDTDTSGTLIFNPLQILGSEFPYSWASFATAIIFVDINGDGIPDILVGSANASETPGINQTGLVELFLGRYDYETGRYWWEKTDEDSTFNPSEFFPAGAFGFSVAGVKNEIGGVKESFKMTIDGEEKEYTGAIGIGYGQSATLYVYGGDLPTGEVAAVKFWGGYN